MRKIVKERGDKDTDGSEGNIKGMEETDRIGYKECEMGF